MYDLHFDKMYITPLEPLSLLFLSKELKALTCFLNITEEGFFVFFFR